MTFLKGLVEGNLNEVKQQDINADKIYIVKDLPENSITNDTMQSALTDNAIAAFFQLNNTYICIDDGTYTKGHTYKFTGDTWEDLTPVELKNDGDGTKYLSDNGEYKTIVIPKVELDEVTINRNTENKLQAVGVKYNDNLIIAEMIYNATHYIRYKEDEPTPPTPTKEAGLYVDGVLSKSWTQLLSDGDVTITNGALKVTNTSLAGDLVCDNVEGLNSLELAFENCSYLASIDASKLNTSNVTSMFAMFNNCGGLTSLDLSNFDTSNVTSMVGMFGGCSSLTSLNLSNFNTSNVTKMLSMFNYCISLTSLDISNFTFDKVTDYDEMFTNVPNNCEILVKSQTEKDWITSKFTNLTNVKIKGTPTDGIQDDIFVPDTDWGL